MATSVQARPGPVRRRHSRLSAVEEETTCGLRQIRPSSKPFAASAFAPGPFRGWGRKPRAHIRAQREPVFSPVGTGTEYRQPEGSPDGSHDMAQPRLQGTPRDRGRQHRSVEWRRTRFVEQCPSRPTAELCLAGRAHRRRRERALGSPAERGVVAPPSEATGGAEGFSGVKTPWVQQAACAALRACRLRTRSAACLCSRGSGCTTRTRRSCRCAGASESCIAGMPAMAAA